MSLSREDIDPFYMCELILICPNNDHWDDKITELSITSNLNLDHEVGKFYVFKLSDKASHILAI